MKKLIGFVSLGVFALLFSLTAKAFPYQYVLLPGQIYTSDFVPTTKLLIYHGDLYYVAVDLYGNRAYQGTGFPAGCLPVGYEESDVGDSSDSDYSDSPFQPFESYLLARLIADLNAM